MSIFSQVPTTPIRRSTHRLNHSFKMTGDYGGIYPILAELSFAGDRWSIDLEQFIRSMPMIAPVMDMVDVKVDAFFCPIRLVWDDFEDFLTLGMTGEGSFDWPTITRAIYTPSDPAIVKELNSVFGTGGLADYLNFPSYNWSQGVGGTRTLDAIPFRVYQTIWNEYYRNENLDSEIIVKHSSGDTLIARLTGNGTNYSDFFIRYRGWNKDYFTSALPFPQKGPAVRLPNSDVVITADPDEPLSFTATGQGTVSPTDDPHNITSVINGVSGNTASGDLLLTTEDGLYRYLNYDGGLKAATSFAPTIEELRYAECLQEYYEASARGGSRPKEYYLNIWHTRTKDARLDRPEYLGGYRGPVTITDVDQTSQSDISAQATPAGKGISAGGNRVVRYRCPEHGYFMILVSVVPRSSYCQGFRKQNLYRDPFDFPNPFFANLGEQEIKNLEIYDDPSDGLNDGTFGYTPRYAEAKFIPSTVHGKLRSNMNYWTLARQFSSRPNLNSAFVHINPSEVSRIFPDQENDNDKFVATFYFKIKRSMFLPYWGIPRLIHSV